MAAFQMPELLVQADMWGPPADAVPEQFKDLPFYRDFSKSAHLGRAADWTAAGEEQQEYRQLMRQNRIDRERAEAGEETDAPAERAEKKRSGGGIFGYSEGDESGFQLVDTSSAHSGSKMKSADKFGGRGRGRGAPWARGRGRGGRGWGQPAPARTGSFAQKKETGVRNDGQSRYGRRWRQRWRGRGGWANMGGWGRQEDDEGVSRPWALVPQDEWDLITQFEIPKLEARRAASLPKVEDLQGFGTLRAFDRSFDRCTTKSSRVLNAQDDTVFPDNLTSSEDPILKEMVGDAPSSGLQIFATAGIVAHLMSTPRSAASWDVIVRRDGNKLFFDKRDDSEELNLLSVHENGVDPPLGPESTALNTEATFINQVFSQQVLLPAQPEEGEEAAPTIVLGGPSPFVSDGEQAASIGYKYRRFQFDVDDQDVSLTVRCEYDACMKRGNDVVPITVKALNESFWAGSEVDDRNKWKRQRDSSIDWRQRVDSQRSAVLAHELKLNANKVAKWMCESVLADTKVIKLGYVSRVSPKNNFNHEVLGVQELAASEFAAHIQFDAPSAWGILQGYISECAKLDNGLYMLLRVPDQGLVHLYKVPSLDGLNQQQEDEDETDFDF
jgi:translation initiation factor 3 subunit D